MPKGADMVLRSIRQQPAHADIAIAYIQQKWANPQSMAVYEDCIRNCLHASAPLPQWYLLEKAGRIIGCAGLITNDFISRMDLYPWLCALYIEPDERGHGYGELLVKAAAADAKAAGFPHLFLCTDHIGYYEKMGFTYLANGFHPWGETSRIYQRRL